MRERIIERLEQEDGQCTMADLLKWFDVTPETLPNFEEALLELEQDECITIMENHASAAFDDREPDDMVMLRA